MPRAVPVLGKFGCFLIGGRSLLIQCAEVLLRRGHQVYGLISDDPSVEQWAKEQGLPHLTARADLVASLGRQPFDYLFSIVNFSVLPKGLLALPKRGAVNFHDGPLPEYAGLNVTSWALINQETAHGVTWHAMTDQVDRGEVLKQTRFPVVAGETALSLNMKCYEAALVSFEELVEELAEGREVPQRQDLARQAYYARQKRPAAACILDWRRSAEELNALARALDYGPYPNPLGLPKLWLGTETVVVASVEVIGSTLQAPASTAEPGTVTRLTDGAIRVAAANGEVSLSGFHVKGKPLSVADLTARFGVREGTVLPALGEERAGRLTRLYESWSKHEPFWVARLAELEPIEIPYAKRPASDRGSARFVEAAVVTPTTILTTIFANQEAETPGDFLIAAYALYFSRLCAKERFAIPFQDASLREDLVSAEGVFASHVPLVVDVQQQPFAAFQSAFMDQLKVTKKRRSYARDLSLRHPHLRTASWQQEVWPVALERIDRRSDEHQRGLREDGAAELTIVIPDDGRVCSWRYDAEVFDGAAIERMQAQVAALLDDLAAARHQSVAELSVLSPQDRSELFSVWNATRLDYSKEACLHQLVERQATRTPQATAVIFRDDRLSYEALNARANQLARLLTRRGVASGALVGVLMDRSLDLIVAMLGILKAGAAYVPLDPTYPEDRLAFMIDDARVAAVVTQTRYADALPGARAAVIALDKEQASLQEQSTLNLAANTRPDSLAYVIYTSGSTGKPKGVMVEHRNVVNFFTGMDQRLDYRGMPGVWLAVTSVSFDISILEIFWTLARGFTVVLYAEDDQEPVSSPTRQYPNAHKELEFSLFYFASDEGERAGNKYDLLLEGARFADEHGFSAVWTPERHFHAFGGLYPNPAVIGAALATITKRIQLRAGSCVLPLHSPIRVAEEWSLVDNLSGGRVGVSFASGWQPDDFAIAPQNYRERHALLERGIETVRALWRGEALAFPGPNGKDVTLSILPRPVQAELPVWVTAAGNPETFRKAGEIGANLLTHLLGQTVEELAEKLTLYQEAWRRHGHSGSGQVSLMLHTFVGDDEAHVRAQVHGPLKNYLRSATGLLKQHASSFPTFKRASLDSKSIDEQFEAMSEEDMDALLEYSFERYYQTSGLFGTPERCLALVDRLKGIGVNEVACLIDFGVPSPVVMAHLPHLDRLRQLAAASQDARERVYTIPDLVQSHQVTHLQFTPSMARMLVADHRARDALPSLKKMMVGGEAFPGDLAVTLRSLVGGDVINMYGPTETTIWSTTHLVEDAELADVKGSVPIGRPIANTRIYLLDANLQPLPVGVPGELVIAGDGVVRGYLNRPEMTAERFVPDPFGGAPGSKMYRTGDLARYRGDGVLEFLGRIDHQVKIRGYRIELGEIEAVLGRHPAVRQAAVVAREDTPGDKRLVAYVIPKEGATPSPGALRSLLKQALPNHMVPAAFVLLEAFPLTPNKKIDRRALPAPDQTRPELAATYLAPRNKVEEEMAKIWSDVLGIEEVGVHDNFFELGGDSILAIYAVSRANRAGLTLNIRQLVQHQTIAKLATLPDAVQTVQAEQGLVTGPLPLTPAQHRFFYERKSPDPHHWNHALLLELTHPSNPVLLKRVVEHLLIHHDALRLRFAHLDSKWQLVNAGLAENTPFSTTDLSMFSAEAQKLALKKMLAELQGSLDLAEGPLLRVAHFDLGAHGPNLLLVTMHHLVVDPVSWRIFWEDFQTAYRQSLLDEAIKLPRKTASFKFWAESLEQHARSEALRQRLDDWLALPWSQVRPLPLDHANDRFSDNINAAYGTVSASLNPEETRKLLHNTRKTYRIEEFLATALVQALAPWTGSSALLFDMVGLSRNDLKDIDLSRTMGYFVSYNPWVLTLDEAFTPHRMLESLAEQVRRFAAMGGSYDLLRYLSEDSNGLEALTSLPRAEIVLNYRGAHEHDQSFLDASLFKPAQGSTGPTHSPRGLRHHPLNISCDLYEDRFNFTFTFSNNLHERATIERLAKGVVEALRVLTDVVNQHPADPHGEKSLTATSSR